MAVFHISKEDFNREVLESEQVILLDFWADWCGPCRMLAPILDEVAEERPDVKVCKVNVDEAPELAKEFRVISIPSLFVLEKGKVIAQAVGVKPKEQILNLLP